MSGNQKLAHVVLQTSKLAEMRDFYAKVLNAHVVFEGPGLCFMTFDEEHHRIAFMSPPIQLEAKSPLAAGLHHSAYTFADLDDLLDRYTDLANQGVKPVVPVQHGVTTSLYYQDPDGNFVELQVDNFATAEEATAYMMGAEYSADPAGPTFDPELLLEARRAGTEPQAILNRAWALSGPPLPNALEAFSTLGR
jgi:catechol-2,3-dioxygenase